MKRTEHTQKWLDALRSGKYKQGFGGLNRKGEFCCLGVACDVHSPDAWIDCGNYHGHTFGAGTMNAKGLVAFGMTETESSKLICLNDNGDSNFPEIADAIEAMIE